MYSLATIRSYLRAASVMLLICVLLLGVAYPLLVTAVAQLAFPHQAEGSLIREEGMVTGSELIGKAYDDPRYFWGRPSALVPPYHPGASGASNLAPSNPALAEVVSARIEVLRKADPANKRPVPIELVTASASGLDPHISPEAARYQVGRVAKARKLKEAEVEALIEAHTEGPQFGIFGLPRINVQMLNRALDEK